MVLLVQFSNSQYIPDGFTTVTNNSNSHVSANGSTSAVSNYQCISDGSTTNNANSQASSNGSTIVGPNSHYISDGYNTNNSDFQVS